MKQGLTEQHWFGIAATCAIHLGLVIAVVVGARLGRTAPKKESEEKVIAARLVKIQAGDERGKRTKGPVYKGSRRKAVKRRARRTRRTRRARSPSRLAPTAASMSPDPVDDRDDATDVPKDWGMTAGDPSGTAKPMGDGQRRGAGGMDAMGILDPCASRQAQVIGSFQAKARAKIGRIPRPTFVSAEVAANLRTKIRITFDVSGRIVGASVASSSGNPAYDQAAARYIKGLGSFEKPHKCIMYDKRRRLYAATRSFTIRTRTR